MTDLKHTDSLESLTARFNRAAKKLLSLDGVTLFKETENFGPVQDLLKDLQEDPSSRKNLERAAGSVNLFESYAHKAALMGTDKLTQLPNRAAFDEQMRVALKKDGTPTTAALIEDEGITEPLERRQFEEGSADVQNHFALVFLDLDRFKGLNDDHGHETGDVGLQAFAHILNNIVRDDDESFFDGTPRVARLGGDEFSIILNTKAGSSEEAKNNFEKALMRIRKELAIQSFEHNGKIFPLVSSCGLHVFEEGNTPTTILNKADEALYQHKTGLDENKRTKVERYEYAVREIKKKNPSNLAAIEDKRADEQVQLTMERIGAAVLSLQKTGPVAMIVQQGSEPDAIKTLKDNGVTVLFDHQAADYYHDYETDDRFDVA